MKSAGIVGGIGPESTVQYYQLVVKLYRERTGDGSYPSVLINSIDVTKMLPALRGSPEAPGDRGLVPGRPWLGLALVATLLSIWLRVATALSEIVVGTVAQLLIAVSGGAALLVCRGQRRAMARGPCPHDRMAAPSPKRTERMPRQRSDINSLPTCSGTGSILALAPRPDGDVPQRSRRSRFPATASGWTRPNGSLPAWRPTRYRRDAVRGTTPRPGEPAGRPDGGAPCDRHGNTWDRPHCSGSAAGPLKEFMP
jgi:hypothetical protein